MHAGARTDEGTAPAGPPLDIGGRSYRHCDHDRSVTVTAFIGQGGLGQLIIQGFSEDFNTPIFVGLALSVLLAAVADALIVGLERVSLPWMRRRRAAS